MKSQASLLCVLASLASGERCTPETAHGEYRGAKARASAEAGTRRAPQLLPGPREAGQEPIAEPEVHAQPAWQPAWLDSRRMQPAISSAPLSAARSGELVRASSSRRRGNKAPSTADL